MPPRKRGKVCRAGPCRHKGGAGLARLPVLPTALAPYAPARTVGSGRIRATILPSDDAQTVGHGTSRISHEGR